MKLQQLAFWGSLLAGSAWAKLFSVDEDEFEKLVIQSGKPSFVKFYAPWCFHCQQMEQTWEDLADAYAEEDINIVEVNADVYTGLRKRYGISSFPQVKLFKPEEITVPVDYTGERSIEEFSKFLGKELDLKAEIKKPSMIVQFNDVNVEKLIEVKDNNALLLFTDEECEQCDDLLQTFETVANAFHMDNNKILIGQVKRIGADATDWIRNKFHIGHYPSIVYVEAGDMDKYHFWDRELNVSDFVDFINAKIGTKRGVDGLLEKSAGIIEEIDEYLAKFLALNIKGRRGYIDTFVKELRKVDVERFKDELKYYAVCLNQFNSNNQKFFLSEKEKYQKVLNEKSASPEMKDAAAMKLNFLNHCDTLYTEHTWKSQEEVDAEEAEEVRRNGGSEQHVLKDEL